MDKEVIKARAKVITGIALAKVGDYLHDNTDKHLEQAHDLSAEALETVMLAAQKMIEEEVADQIAQLKVELIKEMKE